MDKGKILSDYMKGQRCVVCAFKIELPEDIIEVEGGYAHKECLAERDNKNEDNQIDRE